LLDCARGVARETTAAGDARPERRIRGALLVWAKRAQTRAKIGWEGGLVRPRVSQVSLLRDA
jgi:hypothetical protein